MRADHSRLPYSLSSALLCSALRARAMLGGRATPSVRSLWLIRDRMRPRAQALLRDRTCSRSDPTSSTRASSAVRGSRGLTADQSRCRRALAIDPRRHTDVRGSCRSPDHALRVMITVTIADTHVGVQITDVFYLPRTHSLVRVRRGVPAPIPYSYIGRRGPAIYELERRDVCAHARDAL